MTTDTIAAPGRPSCLTHPVQAWRALLAAQAERADTQARAAGLTVEVLPNGVRRYRDAHLDDALPAYRARHPAPQHADLSDARPGSSQWSPVRLVTAGPAAPATGMTDRLRRAKPLAGAGAVPPPTVPHQGRSAGSASLRDHLTVALDPRHPAAAVSGAPRAGAQQHAPARLLSGPAKPPGGAR